MHIQQYLNAHGDHLELVIIWHAQHDEHAPEVGPRRRDILQHCPVQVTEFAKVYCRCSHNFLELP